jgi:cysteine synthase A
VSDPAIEPPLQRRLEDLGTRLEICREPAAVGGFQGARLARMAQLQAEYPDHFWPSQYNNPHNPEAYAPVAELLAETVGEVHCLVGTVGSGGSMSGTTKFLRTLFPNMKAVAVDTHGSVLFGQPDGKTRLLRGLGNSVMPGNLDHKVFDEVHWVSAAEGFGATRALHRKHALYMGATSGTAYLVAEWWARKNPDANVAVLMPDEGYRYEHTVYSDEWLRSKGAYLETLPSKPRVVDDPLAAGPDWSYMAWNQRTYEQVMGAPFKKAS